MYVNGVQQTSSILASWYTEGAGSYRGILPTFPKAGLVLLSNVALTILDETTASLNMWMQFLLADSFALANNFNGELNGWQPAKLAYADGIISVIYTPDSGNLSGLAADDSGYNVNSNMVVNLDFAQDRVYIDVAVSS